MMIWLNLEAGLRKLGKRSQSRTSALKHTNLTASAFDALDHKKWRNQITVGKMDGDKSNSE